MKLKLLTTVLLGTLAIVGTAYAAPTPAKAKPVPPPAAAAKAPATQEATVAPDPVRLAGAYQSGYLSIMAAACFQLYSSMGIIASDIAAGHINGETALAALDQNALLLTACTGSLADVRELTSADDAQAGVILGRLDEMLTALGALDNALVDVASAKDAKAQQAAVPGVDKARLQVEAALEAYGKPLP